MGSSSKLRFDRVATARRSDTSRFSIPVESGVRPSIFDSPTFEPIVVNGLLIENRRTEGLTPNHLHSRRVWRALGIGSLDYGAATRRQNADAPSGLAYLRNVEPRLAKSFI